MWLTWSFQCLSYWIPHSCQDNWPFWLFETVSSLGLNDTNSFHFFFLFRPVLLLDYVGSSSLDSLWTAVYPQGPALNWSLKKCLHFLRAFVFMYLLMTLRGKSAVRHLSWILISWMYSQLDVWTWISLWCIELKVFSKWIHYFPLLSKLLLPSVLSW